MKIYCVIQPHSESLCLLRRWFTVFTVWFTGFDIEGLPTAVWPGGETEALTRIERHLERKVSTAPAPQLRSIIPNDKMCLCHPLCLYFQAWVANFERPRMNANSLLASPTGLSPYLRFGCLSCRLFYFKLTDLYRKVRIYLSEAAVFSPRRSIIFDQSEAALFVIFFVVCKSCF